MNNKNYTNNDESSLYILHFPGTGIQGHENIIQENLDRTITLDSNLSIISIMNQECWNESYIVKQCEKNNIKIYNTALNERQWNNTLKINHISKCLNKITTDYVLVMDGRDTLIVNDLDKTFINKFCSYEKPIIYNATPIAYPNVVIEPLQELLTIQSNHKYLNAGVCIGTRAALIQFYEKAKSLNESIYNNKSEQYIIRLAKEQNPRLVGIDSNINLFRIVHQYDTIVRDNGNVVQLI